MREQGHGEVKNEVSGASQSQKNKKGQVGLKSDKKLEDKSRRDHHTCLTLHKGFQTNVQLFYVTTEGLNKSVRAITIKLMGAYQSIVRCTTITCEEMFSDVK